MFGIRKLEAIVLRCLRDPTLAVSVEHQLVTNKHTHTTTAHTALARRRAVKINKSTRLATSRVVHQQINCRQVAVPWPLENDTVGPRWRVACKVLHLTPTRHRHLPRSLSLYFQSRPVMLTVYKDRFGNGRRCLSKHVFQQEQWTYTYNWSVKDHSGNTFHHFTSSCHCIHIKSLCCYGTKHPQFLYSLPAVYNVHVPQKRTLSRGSMLQ